MCSDEEGNTQPLTHFTSFPLFFYLLFLLLLLCLLTHLTHLTSSDAITLLSFLPSLFPPLTQPLQFSSIPPSCSSSSSSSTFLHTCHDSPPPVPSHFSCFYLLFFPFSSSSPSPHHLFHCILFFSLFPLPGTRFSPHRHHYLFPFLLPPLIITPFHHPSALLFFLLVLLHDSNFFFLLLRQLLFSLHFRSLSLSPLQNLHSLHFLQCHLFLPLLLFLLLLVIASNTFTLLHHLLPVLILAHLPQPNSYCPLSFSIPSGASVLELLLLLLAFCLALRGSGYHCGEEISFTTTRIRSRGRKMQMISLSHRVPRCRRRGKGEGVEALRERGGAMHGGEGRAGAKWGEEGDREEHKKERLCKKGRSRTEEEGGGWGRA